MCGHTPGKVAGRQETVKAEMNGLTPGLDRSPPPRWMGGQGGQSLKVFGRTRSFWGLSSPKIEMGGKALKCAHFRSKGNFSIFFHKLPS